MEVKLIEVRDRATCIGALAVRIDDATPLVQANGYAEGHILLTRLHDKHTELFPEDWPGMTRTMPAAHQELYRSWSTYRYGGVLDVEFVLGETAIPKVSDYL